MPLLVYRVFRRFIMEKLVFWEMNEINFDVILVVLEQKTSKNTLFT